MEEFNIEDIMQIIEKKRTGFTLESDFQFVMGCAIQEKYKDARVIMEYRDPTSVKNKNLKDSENDERRYIDILVIMGDKYIPIELKYKYTKCKIKLYEGDENNYQLEGSTCRTTIRQAYVEDILRIENLKKTKIDNPIKKGQKLKFDKGYAILLTNCTQFQEKSYDNQGGFSLCGPNTQTIKPPYGNEAKKNIKTDKSYKMKWYPYPELMFETGNNSNGNFIYLITTIEG